MKMETEDNETEGRFFVSLLCFALISFLFFYSVDGRDVHCHHFVFLADGLNVCMPTNHQRPKIPLVVISPLKARSFTDRFPKALAT